MNTIFVTVDIDWLFIKIENNVIDLGMDGMPII